MQWQRSGAVQSRRAPATPGDDRQAPARLWHDAAAGIEPAVQ